VAVVLIVWCTTSPARGQAAAECGQVHRWAAAALGWEARAETPQGAGLEVRRQDHGHFRLGRSVLDTPLRLGEKQYEHGLGTHSVSEIVVHLPGPAARFTAEVGVDNNDDMQGKQGSVVFAVEVAGRVVFRSPRCRPPGDLSNILQVRRQVLGRTAGRLAVGGGTRRGNRRARAALTSGQTRTARSGRVQ